MVPSDHDLLHGARRNIVRLHSLRRDGKPSGFCEDGTATGLPEAT